MEYAKEAIRPGMTELELVAELEYFMRKNGSDGVPFTMKALTGENAVRTINLPGNNPIRRGSMVLLDFGAVVQRYASDWTRTFAVGECSGQQRELYDLVWKIERTCISMIRPGITYEELMDRAAEVLAGHPWEQWFNPFWATAWDRKPGMAVHRAFSGTGSAGKYGHYHRTGYLYSRIRRIKNRRYGAGNRYRPRDSDGA